jgi:hypothetical protein
MNTLGAIINPLLDPVQKCLGIHPSGFAAQ